MGHCHAIRTTALGCLLLLLCAAQVTARDGEAPAAWLDDAELTSVSFPDAQNGWAVGDRGAVWQTVDGGKHWRLHATGVSARLESVSFVDTQTGWIAGRQFDPYTHATTGIILHTRDAGRHWEAQGPGLPGIARIHFLSPDYGWAVGQPSTTYPAGAFFTENGGKLWRPYGGRAPTTWLGGDLYDPLTGALVGDRGQILTVRRRELLAAQVPPLGLRGVRALKFQAPLEGWLVGDAALVMETADGGTSWQPRNLPGGGLDALFDWTTVATHGKHLWIAGSPGTRIAHSADQGDTWEWLDTNQNLPIKSLSFVNERNGWAVGALGTILCTEDGGRTWQKQKGGGTRAALLAIFAEPQELPLELLARLAGNDGYLSVAHFITRPEAESLANSIDTLPQRTQAAVMEVGASQAETQWRFPLRRGGLNNSAQTLVGDWDRYHDGGALKLLEAQLVRSIRQWRPEVVLTSATQADARRPLAHVVNQVVLRAVEAAADATQYPEQGTLAGLRAWQVRKVFGSLGPGQPGEVQLDATQLAVRIGQSLGDMGCTARGLLDTQPQPPPTLWGFQRLRSRQTNEPADADFFAGLVLHPGGEARRRQLDASLADVNAIRKMTERRRNFDAIIARSDRDPTGGERLIGQAGDMVRGLDPRLAGQVLFQLAAQYHRTGRWSLAAETYELLLQEYPQHPSAGKAAQWLVQYWSSSEAAWREQHAQKMNVRSGGNVRPEILPNTSPFGQLQAAALTLDQTKMVDRPARAAEFAKWLETHRPMLYPEPEVRFPLAAAHRSKGLPKQAERFYFEFRQGRTEDAWWACAQGERWLADPQGIGPKSDWSCMPTAHKPVLDGRFDDVLWKHAKPIQLKSPAGDDAAWPAACLVAYDSEFLYLGISCRRAPGCEYRPASGPRPRDPDLSTNDRVQVWIDLDRDWTTAYHFVMDHHGWVAEDCWGDSTWNPQWYVAAAEHGDRWSVEVAIPFEELTGTFPTANNVWAVSAVRTVPGAGYQSWTEPSAPTGVLPAAGYLIFR